MSDAVTLSTYFCALKISPRAGAVWDVRNPAAKSTRCGEERRRCGQQRRGRKIRASFALAKIFPRLFVAVIHERAEDEPGRGQDQCLAEIAHHNVVGGKVHRRGKDPEGDG